MCGTSQEDLAMQDNIASLTENVEMRVKVGVREEICSGHAPAILLLSSEAIPFP